MSSGKVNIANESYFGIRAIFTPHPKKENIWGQSNLTNLNSNPDRVVPRFKARAPKIDYAFVYLWQHRPE